MQKDILLQAQHDVALALQEDVGAGDITAQLVSSKKIQATIISREDAVLAGIAWANETFRQLDASIEIQWRVQDGEQLSVNQCLCSVSGPADKLLTGERVALNFLQTLSAVATQTKKYVELIAGLHCKILDTRKTIPGLRLAQKYAVVCGGGHNHRKGLYDGVLIKENHILAAGSIAQAVAKARTINHAMQIEVEVESLEELQQALMAKADIVLLDNFALDQLRQAVLLNNGQAQLEASGGINELTVRAVAETGVDFISVGALTKNIQAVDLSMRFES